MYSPPNSAFHPTIPNLQVVWDSTSLRALMFCPRSYQYGIVQGWRGQAVDLEFGIYFANGVETYAKTRLAGHDKEYSTRAALQRVVEDTWLADSEDEAHDWEHGSGKPWGGVYADEWQCTGTKPFKNARGNRAKCPFNLKGRWFPGNGPSCCGSCGSSTVAERHYLPNDAKKNRLTAYYCYWMVLPRTARERWRWRAISACLPQRTASGRAIV